jgi:curved DNA-binding protein CbpA
VTLDDALAALGLDRATTWSEIRTAYRARIRAVHPDLTADSGGAAARLNAAFSLLERVYRRGEPAPSAGATPRRAPRPAPPEPPLDLALVDDDGLALVAPPDEVFHRLAAAIDDIGDLTYADPEAGYLEALVAGGAGQLVVSLQGRAHATEAFFTLEPLGAAPVPELETIVRELAALLRRTRG